MPSVVMDTRIRGYDRKLVTPDFIGRPLLDFVTPDLIALLSGINRRGHQPNKVAWFFSICSSFCLRLPYAWR